MRIAVYGGSFNPPHVVHGQVTSWLLASDLVDEVWLLPVFRHAFEGTQGKQLAAFSTRVRWCQALARDVGPRVRVCEEESSLPVPSFTIDTLSHLMRVHPGHEFRLVVGSDVLDQIDSWRDWGGIQAKFAPIVVGRQGHPAPDGVPVFPDVSSTEIRQRLGAGKSVSALLTPGVAALLVEEGAWAD
jgi:nicotinate-nucleotide adenylyltransferase